MGPSLGEVFRRMVSISDAKKVSRRAWRLCASELCSDDGPIWSVLLLMLDVCLLEPGLEGFLGAILVEVYFEMHIGSG